MRRNAASYKIAWKAAAYHTDMQVLKSPIYAGAYVFGRTGSRVVIEDGRKRVIQGLRADFRNTGQRFR